MWKLLLRSSQGSSPVGVDFCHWLPDLHTHLVLLDTYVLFAFLSIKYHIRNLIVQAVDEQSMHHGSRFYASVRSSILFPRDFRTTQQRRPLIAKYIWRINTWLHPLHVPEKFVRLKMIYFWAFSQTQNRSLAPCATPHGPPRARLSLLPSFPPSPQHNVRLKRIYASWDQPVWKPWFLDQRSHFG